MLFLLRGTDSVSVSHPLFSHYFLRCFWNSKVKLKQSRFLSYATRRRLLPSKFVLSPLSLGLCHSFCRALRESLFSWSVYQSPTCVRRYLQSGYSGDGEAPAQSLKKKKREKKKQLEGRGGVGGRLESIIRGLESGSISAPSKPHVNIVHIPRSARTRARTHEHRHAHGRTNKHFSHLSGGRDQRDHNRAQVFGSFRGETPSTLWRPVSNFFYKQTTAKSNITPLSGGITGYYAMTACDGNQRTVQILSVCIRGFWLLLIKQSLPCGGSFPAPWHCALLKPTETSLDVFTL